MKKGFKILKGHTQAVEDELNKICETNHVVVISTTFDTHEGNLIVVVDVLNENVKR